MKRIATCTMFLIFSATSFSQLKSATPTLTKEDYLQKSKRQKTTAWLMLGGGIVVGFVGLTQFNFAGSVTEVNNTPGTVLFLTGNALVIGSIPFFSASKRNRKKAMSMSFQNQPLPKFPRNSSITGNAIPSLTLEISL